MAEKFELLPTDIDLTERNVFGRSNNEFQPELVELSKIPDGIDEVERRLAPPRNYEDDYNAYFGRGYRYNLTRTYNTSTRVNSMAEYYTNNSNFMTFQPITTINITYNNMMTNPNSFVFNSGTDQLINIGSTETNVEFDISDVISLFRVSAEAYIESGNNSDILTESIREMRELFTPSYMRGRLLGIKTHFNYINTNINDDWIFTSTSTVFDEMNDYDIELEPACIKDLSYSDIDKCYKDENALIIGKGSSYIKKIYRWCEILRKLIRPIKVSIPSVNLDRYGEYKLEFDKTLSRYNGLEKFNRYKLRYYSPYPHVIEDGLSFYSHLRSLPVYPHHTDYSELPGLYVTDEFISESYPDIFRQDSYPDRGLHLLRMGVPQYSVIEYDLNSMEAIEPDEYRRHRSVDTSDTRLQHQHHEIILSRKE